MSSATQQNVNPYASPSVPVAQLVPDDARSVYRASEGMLKYISQHACVANLTYLLNVICFFLTFFFGSREFTWILICVTIVLCFVLWYCTLAIAFASRNYVDAGLAALLVPIPALGSLVFFFVISGTKKFMVCNGYRPGLLGFKPVVEERNQMQADPKYVPSRFCQRDGSRRPKVYMLGECVFVLVLIHADAGFFMT